MPRLVLIRHGQSAWNLENRFTGWWDVDVTDKGAAEARAAGELMAAKGLDFDMTFTSLQTRAIKTLNLALEAMGRLWLPVEKDWRLNERHYGGLTGLDKAETAAKHGDEQVHIWRRSFDIDPGSGAKGGDLDWANPSNFVPEFSEAMGKLNKGETTSVPVKSQFGYHIIRVDDIRQAQLPKLDEVKPQITQQLQQQRLQKYQDDLRAKAKIE